MALLVDNVNIIRVWDDGLADRAILYVLRGVSAGDTFNLVNDFNPPLRAALVGITVAGALIPTFTGGTTIVIPNGVSNAAALLLVYGVHA